MSDKETEPTGETSFDAELEAGIDAAMHEGFGELSNLPWEPGQEDRVLAELSSGRDFDPWTRQIARRLAWIAIPAAAAFTIVYAAIALLGVPAISTSRLAKHDAVIAKLDEYDKELYKDMAVPIPREPLSVSKEQIGSTNPDAPAWSMAHHDIPKPGTVPVPPAAFRATGVQK